MIHLSGSFTRVSGSGSRMLRPFIRASKNRGRFDYARRLVTDRVSFAASKLFYNFPVGVYAGFKADGRK